MPHCNTHSKPNIGSREEARRLFLKSPFFQTWDPAVLDAYVQYGLTEDQTSGGVKLKMPGFQVGVCVSWVVD